MIQPGNKASPLHIIMRKLSAMTALEIQGVPSMVSTCVAMYIQAGNSDNTIRLYGAVQQFFASFSGSKALIG